MQLRRRIAGLALDAVVVIGALVALGLLLTWLFDAVLGTLRFAVQLALVVVVALVLGRLVHRVRRRRRDRVSGRGGPP